MLPRLPSDVELRLATSRLVLEPVLEAHAEELWELFRDLRLHRYTPFEPESFEKQRERCIRWSRRRSPNGFELWLNWAARERVSGKVIGHFQAGVHDGGLASLGYLIAASHQGSGFASEGLSEVLRFLREQMEVREVKAWIDTRNEASIALVKKLGMEQVEMFRDADFFKGSTSDELVFAKRLG